MVVMFLFQRTLNNILLLPPTFHLPTQFLIKIAFTFLHPSLSYLKLKITSILFFSHLVSFFYYQIILYCSLKSLLLDHCSFQHQGFWYETTGTPTDNQVIILKQDTNQLETISDTTVPMRKNCRKLSFPFKATFFNLEANSQL